MQNFTHLQESEMLGDYLQPLSKNEINMIESQNPFENTDVIALIEDQENQMSTKNILTAQTTHSLSNVGQKYIKDCSNLGQYCLQANMNIVQIQQNNLNIGLNSQEALTSSASFHAAADSSNLNINAKCFVPQNWKNKQNPIKRQNVASKQIFRVVHSNVKRGGGKMSRSGELSGYSIRDVLSQIDLEQEISNQISQKKNKSSGIQLGETPALLQNQQLINKSVNDLQIPKMTRRLSQDSDFSEPRTTAMSSMVMDNSIVFNKARTCIKDKDITMKHSFKEVKPFSDIPIVSAKPLSCNGISTAEQKMEKLRKFRQMRKEQDLEGVEYCKKLSDIQICLQEKELMENIKMFKQDFDEEEIMGAAREPLIGHNVTKEYRTKMIDWMIEVCTSFKFSNRTYFLAVAILDKYFIASHQYGKVLENKDVHPLGVTALYMASKYEDVFPLHSKIVAEKIAHFAISAENIVKKEREILQMFGFQLDFVTHFDFYQTYTDKIDKQLQFDIKSMQDLSPDFVEKSKYLTGLLGQMGLYLTKMAIQCADFCPYTPSTLVIASLYSATAFLKHSQQYSSPDTDRFCTEVRRIIFSLTEDEKADHAKIFQKHQHSVSIIQIQKYQNQYEQEFIEQVAMDLVDFYKIFDEWHCGLNQLKKFNQVPFE